MALARDNQGSMSDLNAVSLDDKYDLGKERVFLTGSQAIVRLLLMQRERDRLAGLNTAGLISGYRGSPIGGLDLALYRIKDKLKSSHIVFQPGLNEELAATAVWARSRPRSAATASTTACSASGTARARRRPLRRRVPPRQHGGAPPGTAACWP
jgi:hypothetical protein